MIVAALVKTPGVSPAKTRLAATIGSEPAAQFYDHALKCTEELLLAAQETLGAQSFWAVAEDDQKDHPLWAKLPTFTQGGKGGLGERLAHVSDLAWKERNGPVVLLGADTPQLSMTVLQAACQKLMEPNVESVLGPSTDGGYYLCAMSRPIAVRAWTSVHYSRRTTRAEFLTQLGSRAVLTEDILSDVDEIENLLALDATFHRSKKESLTPAQSALKAWLLNHREKFLEKFRIANSL